MLYINNQTKLLVILFASIMGFNSAKADNRAYAPKPNSSERQDICNASRSYVIRKYVLSSRLPKPIVFKIEKIQVLRNYCFFKATPIFQDGSSVGTEYIMDIVFEFCLKRENEKWQLLYDLSSTDVPSDSQIKEMWKTFPKEFPLELVPEFWREKFNKSRTTDQ